STIRVSSALPGRTSSSTMVKWLVPAITSQSALTPTLLQLAATSRAWRWNSALSSPPTAARRYLRLGGGGRNSGLAARAVPLVRARASLRLVPSSGPRSNTPLMAQPERTRSAGTPAALEKLRASISAVRWPPAECPITTGYLPSFFHSATRQAWISWLISITETAGDKV